MTKPTMWLCAQRRLWSDWADAQRRVRSDWASAQSDQSLRCGMPSLIRVFAVRMKKGWILSYPLNAQRRLWSDWADAQADLSLRCVHSHFVGFVLKRLNFLFQALSLWCSYQREPKFSFILVSSLRIEMVPFVLPVNSFFKRACAAIQWG